MSNKPIDIETVNNTLLTVPQSSTQSSPSFSDAYYSLFIVLGLIVVLAFIVKKMGGNTRFKKSKHLEVIDSVSVGTKEKVVIVRQKNKLLTIGVTSNQITLLDKTELSREEEMNVQTNSPENSAQNKEKQVNGISGNFKNTLDKLINKKNT